MGSLLMFNASTRFATKFQFAKFSPSQSRNDASFKLVHPTLCVGTIDGAQPAEIVTRRSGNYPPPLWDDRYIQSLTSVYNDETHMQKAEKLKNDVRLMIQRATRPLDQLELMDDLQRLGLSYGFEDIIETTLKNMYDNFNDNGHDWKENDLYTTSLQFRLLRDHGFHVSQDVFVRFTNESGDFKPSLWTDTKGLLSLYEASYLSIEGETILDQARDFSARHLVNNLNTIKNDVLAMQVTNALEIPLHWRMLRNQAWWSIHLYELRSDMNPILLELAKLDFNLVQSTHQKDLKVMSRWWKKTGLAQKLPFVRDRLLENFFWTIGIIFEPVQGYCRQMYTMINVLITTIDDVYDIYGTLDELELFTDAVERWDINTMDQLPDYMKICFLALFNSTNDMAYNTLKEHGYNPISHMKKGWTDLCKSFLLEARWYHGGYQPSLDEYLNNACISSSAPAMLTHVYFILTNSISKEALECIETSSVIRCSSLIFRLADDLATSSDEMKRGDVPKSIQCFMNDTGATEEEAREHIRSLISQTWKKMNIARFAEGCHFSRTFVATAMNLGRTAQFMYHHGNGHGDSNNVTRDQILRLLIDPICID